MNMLKRVLIWLGLMDISKFYLNEANHLFMSRGLDSNGNVILQESFGGVITVSFEQLKEFKPVKDLLDKCGLKWKLNNPVDISSLVAVNDIGDALYGGVEIQAFLDGQETMFFEHKNF